MMSTEKSRSMPWFAIVLAILALATTIGCLAKGSSGRAPANEGKAVIELLGEYHGMGLFYDIELDTWRQRYETGQRDLFEELPYFTAQFLNLWMVADNDDILLQVYEDLDGTATHTDEYLAFLRAIKAECPGTAFHGTDVGHQFYSTGERYLALLESQGLQGSYEYGRTLRAIEQGKTWYDERDGAYRETCMVQNFSEEFDRLGGVPVMGIYGGAHVRTNEGPNMATMLAERYGDVVACEVVAEQVLSWGCNPFGFSFIGLAFVIALFVPNILWASRRPEDYDQSTAEESKVLLAFERAGEVLAVASLIAFKDADLQLYLGYFNGLDPLPMGYLAITVVLMAVYELYWVRYFRSGRTMRDFYSGYAGIPLAGATCPVLALASLALFATNPFMLAASFVLGIGHIGIHAEHARKLR